MPTDIQSTSDLVRAIAKGVSAAIPVTLERIEWSKPSFDLLDLCNRVVLAGQNKTAKRSLRTTPRSSL
jgi:hypothetical protein